MKKTCLWTLVLAALISPAAAQQNPAAPQDTVKQYLQKIARSAKPEDQVKALAAVQQYSRSESESDLIFAMQLASTLKKESTTDSLKKVIRQRFPAGSYVRTQDYNAFINAKVSPKEKQALYDAWIKKYPEPKDNPENLYDYAKMELAYTYANAKDAASTLKWIGRMTPPTQQMARGIYAPLFLNANDTVTAGKLIREQLAVYQENRGQDAGAQSAYYQTLSSLAMLQYKEGHAALALQYAKEAYEHASRKSGMVLQAYALALTANGSGKEAMPILSDFVKNGNANTDVKQALAKAYVQANGSDKDYPAYLATLQSALREQVQRKLSGQMLNTEAPQFALTDVDGKPQTLADLKGKVVIIDFWATWCGPCKKSFPAMQMAVNKYKDDPNVKFLFIDTWEQVADPAKAVKSYITDNHYTFRVLMDTKATGVVEKFGVNGIPAKFIIDGNGKIRFKLTGFDGADDAAVEELSAMIEVTKKQS